MRKLFNLPMWLIVVMGLGFVVLDDELGLVEIAQGKLIEVVSSDERINLNPNVDTGALTNGEIIDDIAPNLEDAIDQLENVHDAVEEAQSWGEIAEELWDSVVPSSEATVKIDSIPAKLASHQTFSDVEDVTATIQRFPNTARNELIWFARGIYSETKVLREQYLVAWVIRNRVEANHRGQSSYHGVLLDPKQFSAFNEDNQNRREIMRLYLSTRNNSWKQALKVALDVYIATDAERPFSADVKHFYSPVGLHGKKAPAWSVGQQPLSSQYLRVNPNRFLFYKGIDPQPAVSSWQTSAQPESAPMVRRSRRRATPTGSVRRPSRPRPVGW